MKNLYPHLKSISPDIKDAFEEFYQTMLKDVHLSSFFDDQEQIKLLIQKQQIFFQKAFDLDTKSLEAAYVNMGEFHYDMRIPYVDYMRGMEILEEHFLIYANSLENSSIIMKEIFSYFKFIKSKTAQGYLNRMLEADEKDIQMFLENTSSLNDDFDKKIVLNRINWLSKLIVAIKNQEIIDVTSDDTEYKDWIAEAAFIDVSKKVFFEDLDKRIDINTQNLFYFLKHDNYVEILPLYESLLNIYKLTLILSNSISLTIAEDLVKNLQIDTLTGLYRKDAFNTFLEKELNLLKRTNSNFSVIYIDIDKFKGVNDVYGHWTGDKVLEKIGQVITSNIRETDIAFRNGGDEFAIILRNANETVATKVCKKIEVEFSSFDFMHNETTFFNVNLSYGVVCCDETNKEFPKDEIIKLVDKRLYEYKKRS